MNLVKVNGQFINLDNVSMVYRRPDSTIGIGWSSHTPDNTLPDTAETAAFIAWLETQCAWGGSNEIRVGDKVELTEDFHVDARIYMKGDQGTVVGMADERLMIAFSGVYDRLWVNPDEIKKVQS